jgi:two-component system, NarL family, sensor kinase
VTGRDLGFADPERERALLIGIIEAISADPELDPLASHVARLVTDATDTDLCYVYVLDDSGRSLTLAGAAPPLDQEVGQIGLPLGTGVSGWVASHQLPAVITDQKEADSRYRHLPQLRGRDFTSMASVPMVSHPGGLVGVLNVHTRDRHEFTERDLQLLTSIGSLIAGAIHQARLHRRLAARERASEQFAEQVIAAEEAERRRLASDIHDGITQRLISLSFHLDAAASALAEAPAFTAEQLVRARMLTRLMLDEARAAINGLRPPVLDDLGLADALASLAHSIGAVEVTVDVDDCQLPEHVEIALYRIAQEALQNVVKHAHTSRATLELHQTGTQIWLRVSDSGGGFDPAAPPAARGAAASSPTGATAASSPTSDSGTGYGMSSMAERAELVGGHLEVLSSPGRGTTVIAKVPAA